MIGRILTWSMYLGMSAFLLWLFISIAVARGTTFGEPDAVVLVLEILICLTGLIIAGVNIYHIVREWYDDKT